MGASSPWARKRKLGGKIVLRAYHEKAGMNPALLIECQIVWLIVAAHPVAFAWGGVVGWAKPDSAVDRYYCDPSAVASAPTA